jgi:hypothetical protein
MKLTIEWPESLPETEYSREFDQGRADRMAVSYCKYGAVAEAYPARVNAIASLRARLERYEQTGNTEWLMDVANFAMIEFMHPRHAAAHFVATDSDQSPGRVWNSGSVTDSANTVSRENARRGGSDRHTSGGFYAREGD